MVVAVSRNQDCLRRVQLKMPIEFSLSRNPQEDVLDGGIIPVAQDLNKFLNHLFILTNDRDF